jgi:hypothetical protein
MLGGYLIISNVLSKHLYMTGTTQGTERCKMKELAALTAIKRLLRLLRADLDMITANFGCFNTATLEHEATL